jgi:hypothetical protein
MQPDKSNDGGAQRPPEAPAMTEAVNRPEQAGVARPTPNDRENTGSRVAFVGNYLPRRCGIATFTTDLCTALAGHSVECLAVAMNDRSERYDYPPPVRFTVEQNDLACYRRAAQFLNNRVDVVSLQHEYGIFGGPAELLDPTRLRSKAV